MGNVLGGLGTYPKAYYDQVIANPDTVPKTGIEMVKLTETNRVKNSEVFPTFDPMYGFPNGRKTREVNTTIEEMENAGVPYKYRDYCIDYHMKLMQCKREKYPLPVLCRPISKELEHCAFDDFIMRMKEYERERRLLVRAKRKGQLDQRHESEVLGE